MVRSGVDGAGHDLQLQHRPPVARRARDPERLLHARRELRLAEAIGRLADDAAFRAACAAHNREDVQRFSARVTAEKTLAVYRSLG